MNSVVKILFITCLSFMNSVAQDAHFTQTYTGALQLNPAFAGVNEHPTITLGYRNQWPELNGHDITGIISYNQFMNKLTTGIGGYYLLEHEGEALTAHSWHLDISPSFSVAKEFVLKPAMEFSFVYKKVNYDELTFGDMIDPRYGFTYPATPVEVRSNISFFDLSTGLLFYHRHFDVGFAVHHIFEPVQSFGFTSAGSKLPRKITIHGSVNFSLNRNQDIFICPYFRLMEQQDFTNHVYGMSLKIKKALLGIGIRERDAMLWMAGVETGRMRVSYSYDHTTSELAGFSGGSHELFLSYFIMKEKLKSKMPSMKRMAF